MWRTILLFNFIFTIFPIQARLSNTPFPDQYADIAREIRDTCLQRLGLTLDDYESFTFNGDRTVMCYVGCVFIEGGWMSERGVMQAEDSSNYKIPADPREVQRYVDNGCPTKPDGDDCERGYKAIDCYRNYSDTIYFP